MLPGLHGLHLTLTLCASHQFDKAASVKVMRGRQDNCRVDIDTLQVQRPAMAADLRAAYCARNMRAWQHEMTSVIRRLTVRSNFGRCVCGGIFGPQHTLTPLSGTS